MDLTPVQSKHVAGYGYDPATGDLHIQFFTGSRYVYRDVPQNVVDEMVSAPSVGNYHAMNIRSQYVYEKVSE